MNFSGTGVALVTPFKANGEIDFIAYEKLINHVVQGGVDYLVVLGTTGESATLTESEKKEIFNFVKEKNAGRVSIVAGIGGHDTREVIRGFEKYPIEGYHGILSVSPYYNKPSQEGIFRHYQELNRFAPLPILAYNVPGRTGSNMLASTTLRIAHELNQIVGIKEASGNFDQCMEIIENGPTGFQVISGDDAYTYSFIGLGMTGVISVMANVCPVQFSKMVSAALHGEWHIAKKNHYQLLALTRMLFADGNPGGAKAALAALGLMEDHLRLPLVSVNPNLKKQIQEEVQRLYAAL